MLELVERGELTSGAGHAGEVEDEGLMGLLGRVDGVGGRVCGEDVERG
jgi:hypothetical protein